MTRLLGLLAVLLFAACTPQLTEANTPGAPPGTDAIHVNAWAVCVRHHESPGTRVWPYEDGFEYETGNGYHGAYQFSQGLWDASVSLAGYPEWAGWPAGWTPWWVQDLAAYAQYQINGDRPWGNRC